MGILGILSFFGCDFQRSKKTAPFVYEKFTIKKKLTKSSWYDVNTASRRKSARTKYNIYYNDEEVILPSNLEKSTGVSGIWKVYMVTDAPQPTLLVGSQSVYLLTEENDKMKIIPVHEQTSDFASLQWLDVEDGQPGEKWKLYASDDTESDHVLEGGDYIFVNERVVLRISDLSLFPFPRIEKENNGFHSKHVIGFSPDKSKIVFMARKYDGQTYQYAHIVHDYRTHDIYNVHFDRNETRLHEPFNMPRSWFMEFFEWIKSEDGSHRLQCKTFDTLPLWEGMMTSSTGYSISPVKPEMVAVFADFLNKHLDFGTDDSLTKDSHGQYEYSLNYKGYRLEVSYFDEDGTVYFSDHFTEKVSEELNALIKSIGDAFNAELRNGMYQEYFTAYKK